MEDGHSSILWTLTGGVSRVRAEQWFLTRVRSNPRGPVSEAEGFGGGQARPAWPGDHHQRGVFVVQPC